MTFLSLAQQSADTPSLQLCEPGVLAASAFFFSMYLFLAFWIRCSLRLWRIFSRSDDDLEKRLPKVQTSSL